DLTAVPEADRFTREAEELDMPLAWVDLDEAHAAVLAGRLHNPSAVPGILAAHAARAAGSRPLRPATAPDLLPRGPHPLPPADPLNRFRRYLARRVVLLGIAPA